MTLLSSIISIALFQKTILIPGDISAVRAKVAAMQDHSHKPQMKHVCAELNQDRMTIYRCGESNGIHATGRISLHSEGIQVSVETRPSGTSIFILIVIFALSSIFTLFELYKSISIGYIKFDAFYFFFPCIFYFITQYIVYFINSRRLITEFRTLILK
jgi:hypothetical protein